MQHKRMMKEKPILRGLMMLVLLAGFFLRVAKSDLLPLDDIEATLAMGANSFFGEDPQISQPFYSVITSLFFWMFEDENFFARLVPILAGSVLITIPWMAGDWLSDRTKFLLSIGLAFDPALVAASKTAGSHIIAVAALLLAIFLFLQRKPIAVGIAAGIFFMSGSVFIVGGLAFGLTLLLFLLRFDEESRIRKAFYNFPWVKMLIAFGISYLLISSTFFIQPSGIGAAFQDIANTFSPSILKPLSMGIVMMILGLMLYESVPLIFATWNLVQNGSEFPLWKRFCLWFSVFAFAVILVNPDRFALNLVWLSVPLWMLAAEQFDRLLEGFRDFDPVSLGVALFFFLMIGFILLTFVGAVNIDGANFQFDPEGNQQKLLIRGILVIGGIILIAITYFLAGYTWNSTLAKNALILGVGIYLLTFGLFQQSWHSAFLGVSPESEFWHQSSVLVDGERILETIEDISEMNHGQRIQQPVTIAGIQSPALEWLLRHQSVRVSEGLAVDETPEIVITSLVEAQLWGAEYTGQDFRLSSSPNWSWLSIQEWLSWAIFHKVGVTTDEMVVVWVRTDLFPGQSNGN
jgi:hypothetical protein